MVTPTISRRDWWIGVAFVVGAVVFHAAWPRYDWRHVTGPLFVRIDRWTGTASLKRVVAEHASDRVPIATPVPGEAPGPLRVEKSEPLAKP